MKNTIDLNFEALINAPVEKVYSTMLNKNTYEVWTEPFCKGSTYQGEWTVGSKIKFIDPSNSGMYSEIAENRKNEFVSIKHLGYIQAGVIDTESDKIKAWAPSFENYTFTEENGQTKVQVYLGVEKEYENMMSELWFKALEKLKEICEN